MGIINKIREKSGIAVGIIAVGLGLFIVGGDILGPNSSLFNTQQAVGSVDGKDISMKEFEEVFQNLKANFEISTRRPPNEQESESLRERAWQQIVFERVYAREFAKIGLEVSKAEEKAMTRGDDTLFIHPQIKAVQFFQDSTGRFQTANVARYLSVIKDDPNGVFEWKSFISGLVQDRINTKYNTLISQSAYVTNAEARLEYEAQNSKVDVRYVYLPFASIADSTIKYTDNDLRSFMSSRKNRYKAQETRSFEYVTFKVAPSGEDSTLFLQDLRDLAKRLATTKDDSAFAAQETEIQQSFNFLSVNQIPDGVFSEERPLIKGGIYGPFANGNNYVILKVVDIREDTLEFARASHILFKAAKDASAEEKADARKRALEILEKIKGGEDFAKMAAIYGSDGTAQNGGDLGWFGRGQMVAPFEKAIFDATQKGLQAGLVETDYGYHIVKVTQPKTKTQYKLAIIEKPLFPSEATISEAYNKALEFQGSVKNADDFRKKIAENPALLASNANKIALNTRNLNDLRNTREIVQWAFKEETKLNEVSSVFDLNEQNLFVVAVLTGKSEKDAADLEYFRDEAINEFLKEKKKEVLLKKLTEAKGNNLEEVSKAYGNNLVVQNASAVTFGSMILGNTGFAPTAVGKAFGLKKGQMSKPFADETGVMMVEVVESNPAAEIADYSQYKNQLLDRQKGTLVYFAMQALQEIYKVEDNKARYY